MFTRIFDIIKNNKIFINYKQNNYNSLVKKIKSQKKISILFLANHISQWKYQTLFNIFSLNKRYSCNVILIPDENYDKNFKNSYEFNKDEFLRLNINLISSYDFNNKHWINLDKKFKPDLVFFSRAMYKHKNKFSIHNFNNSLNCYVPYSLFIDNNDKIQCATAFHQLLWKQFLPFEDNLKIVKKNYAGNNVIITDYLGCDEFKINKHKNNCWKNNNFKKVIWAPHHTIEHYNKKNYFSTFLEMHQKMIELTNKYKNSIDFCFKPHPALKEKLYGHNQWGKEKTLNYFNFWKDGSNTILSETNYQNLFLESDALILDSVSFTAEYLYLNKPFCFLIKNNFDYSNSLNIIGKNIFNIINKASSINEISEFIEKSIFKNDLEKLEKQKTLLNNLNSLNNCNVLASENIYNYINNSLSI